MKNGLSLAILLLTGLFPPVVRAQSGNAPITERGVLSYWDKPWGVQLDLQGLTLKANGYDPDGRRYLLATDDTGALTVSATLEEVPPSRSSQTCKNIYNERVRSSPDNLTTEYITGMQRKNVKIWETGERTYLEYLIPTAKLPGDKKVDVNQQNRFLCLKHDNVFIDLHVSKTDFKPGEEKVFDSLFDSASIYEGITRTSTDYWNVGTAFYNHYDFNRAIAPYAQALALEQNERKLDKKSWYVLVDNLGMAYGETGNQEMARKTIEYGIQNDPDYPMFYYEMADYFGEKGDAQNAMEYLKKAYDRRANFIPGDKFPDPLADDSFRKLLKHQEFRKFIESLPVELRRRP